MKTFKEILENHEELMEEDFVVEAKRAKSLVDFEKRLGNIMNDLKNIASIAANGKGVGKLDGKKAEAVKELKKDGWKVIGMKADYKIVRSTQHFKLMQETSVGQVFLDVYFKNGRVDDVKMTVK